MTHASSKVRVGRLAGPQFGRVTAAQLQQLGVWRSTVRSWTATGYLFPQLPGVYAVGHPGRSAESDLFAAVLYAGPNAALRATTAGLWRGLVKWRTQTAIEISTPRQCRSLPADHPDNRLKKPIDVRDRQPPRRDAYDGIPTVPVANIVLDIAATGDLELVRFVLAQLDYMRILDVAKLERLRGRGIPGSAILAEALANHQPLLAKARSPFEIRLIRVCELTGIPLPEINVKIGGVRPDAVWRDQLVVVECDGELNHGTWRQRKRDASKEMILRALGFVIVRYVFEQLDDPRAIHADLMAILIERAGRARSQRLSA
jgi:very-short-patch-repair endonuclease